VSLRLSSIDFDVVNAARRVLEGSLGLVPGESVLLLLDEARKDLDLDGVPIVRSGRYMIG
jgi:hypothetical protein